MYALRMPVVNKEATYLLMNEGKSFHKICKLKKFPVDGILLPTVM